MTLSHEKQQFLGNFFIFIRLNEKILLLTVKKFFLILFTEKYITITYEIKSIFNVVNLLKMLFYQYSEKCLANIWSCLK